MRRTLAIITILVAAVLAACSSSEHNSGMNGMHGSGDEKNRPVSPGAREIPVTANKLTFTPDAMQLRAGVPVAIVLTSKDLEHDFFVKGIGHIVHAAKDATARGGLTISRPGSYRFWCTVTGHKQGGMVGTITVIA